MQRFARLGRLVLGCGAGVPVVQGGLLLGIFVQFGAQVISQTLFGRLALTARGGRFETLAVQPSNDKIKPTFFQGPQSRRAPQVKQTRGLGHHVVGHVGARAVQALQAFAGVEQHLAHLDLFVVLAALHLVLYLPQRQQQRARSTQAQCGADGGRAMIVLDASGSMWAPVGGRAKIEVAREAMGELLKGWDPKVEVGLMAYGHRRKGDCSDIELLAPAAKLDAARLMGIVTRVQPRGMTPLSAAVKQALAK